MASEQMPDRVTSCSANTAPVPRAPLHVGLVGCGRVGETLHLPALAGLRDRFEVVAAVDVDEHRRRRVAGMFGIRRTFPDVAAMFAAPDLRTDVVAACPPAAFHADVVTAAVAAGKHVLVEKPLALTVADADRIAAAARAAPHLKVQLGFNLRHHRLVCRAKRMIADGLLGDLQAVRTVWTTGIRGRSQLPRWRDFRESGGGVLSEIAVHHIDLLRFLTGAEVEEVFAMSRHGEGDDETASLSLRLRGGAVASCLFSERSADANELEILGSRGRLAFSIYRFDSLSFTPAHTHGGRCSYVLRTLRDVPEYWPILRRGGDFRETYRAEWLSFYDAVRGDRAVAATVEDGRWALRVVLAAGASAAAGAPVLVSEGPDRPVNINRARAEAEPASQQVPTCSDGPQLSAVIATRSGYDAIARTIGHLRAQTACEQIEVIVVCTTGCNLHISDEEMQGFWGHKVLRIKPFDSVAPANAAGARAAAAPVVVLCEDHAFPDPNWAESLIIAHRGPYAVVGPSIHNANPNTMVSRADFLIGYGEWAEPIKPGEPHHLPGHNSAYKRDVLLTYGDRLEEMMEAESVLQWDMRRNGHRLYLDPTARLAHTNFARLGIWTSVQFHAGRVFAATRGRDWPAWKRALYVCASPLIPLIRFKRIRAHARRVGGLHRLRPRLAATLAWGLALDGLGQLVGYVTGIGGSHRIAHEFCRVHHITDDDVRKLPSAATVVTAEQVAS